MPDIPADLMAQVLKDAPSIYDAEGFIDGTQFTAHIIRETRAYDAAEREVLQHQNNGMRKELYECEQVLGTALNYPAEGPEIGGDHTTVCVGEATGCPAILARQLVNEREANWKLLERCKGHITATSLATGIYTEDDKDLIAAITAALKVK